MCGDVLCRASEFWLVIRPPQTRYEIVGCSTTLSQLTVVAGPFLRDPLRACDDARESW